MPLLERDQEAPVTESPPPTPARHGQPDSPITSLFGLLKSLKLSVVLLVILDPKTEKRYMLNSPLGTIEEVYYV